MKFDFATFSTVARGAFYKEFDNFCTCGDVTPVPELECAFGMAGLVFVKTLKESLFKDSKESEEISVSRFDDLCLEAAEKATEGMSNFMIRIGLLAVLANITKEIKKYYKLFNNEEEE